jgi:hypothetical protein
MIQLTGTSACLISSTTSFSRRNHFYYPIISGFFNVNRDITTIHKKEIQGNQIIQGMHSTYPYTSFNNRGIQENQEIQGNQGNQGIQELPFLKFL